MEMDKIRNRYKRKKSTKEELTAPKKLKILCTIVDRRKLEFYIDLLENYEINMQMVVFGRGTAPNSKEYIGFGEQEKAIILSVIKEEKVEEILSALDEKFHKIKHGKGIAYTIPLSSIIGVSIYQFLSNHREDK